MTSFRGEALESRLLLSDFAVVAEDALSPAATGTARVMVLRVYFDDYSATSRYSQAEVDGFFGEIDQLYKDTSYGNMAIDYQVSSLFELPDNRSAYIDDFADGDLSNGGKFDKVLRDAIANSPAGLDWTNLDSIMVLMAETDPLQFHRGQGTSARSLPQGPGGANKTVGAAIFSENPSDSDRAVWGRMAHEVGHAFQGEGPAHPSNYASEFELMDSNYPGQIGVFEKQAGMGFPGWMPEYKYQEFDPVGGGGIASIYTMEIDPGAVPDVQAVRAYITDDLYYLVSVRRRILGDDLNAGFTPNGIPDEGVLIERVVVGADPWVTLQPPPGGTRNDLWHVGDIYTNPGDGIRIEVTEKSVLPDSYVVSVRYNPDVAYFPDVGMHPWTSPPGHTWETTDIWFDSPINGYDAYRYGTWNDLDGNLVPRLNGDPPAVGLPNRVYARVRNMGTSTATDVKVHFEITDPMGVGIAGASGWVLMGSTDKTAFPGLAAIAPGAYVDCWIEWTPDIDVPPADIVDGLFNYHTCVRVKIDPVAGETVLANQDGDREQENISDFQVPEEGGGAPMTQIIRLRNDDKAHDRYFYLNYDDSSLPLGWKVKVNDGKLGMLLKPNEVVEIPVVIDPGGPAPLGGVYSVQVTASRQLEYINDLNPKDRHYHIEPLGGVAVTSRVLRKTGIDADAESHGPNEIEVWGKLLVEEFSRFYNEKNPLQVMLVGLDANGEFIPASARVVPVYPDQTFSGYLRPFEGAQPGAVMVLFAGTDLLATSTSGALGLLGVDFGDAPESAAAAMYPTKLWANGARHEIISGFHLGATVDAEPDGQPDDMATGDDINPAGVPDDEDGVFFATPLTAGARARVDVFASAPGYLDAWLDVNADRDWADAGEKVFASMPLAAGINHLILRVPAGAAIGATFARFRFSSTGGLSFVGAARDGEVEDYRVYIRPAIVPDHFEPSDSLQLATDLGYFGQSRGGLSLGDGDEDWYEWNALDSDRLTIDLGSEEQAGDMILEVYDEAGKLLASSNAPGNQERVSIDVVAGYAYYVHVHEADGLVVSGYWLDWLTAGTSQNYAVLFSGGGDQYNNHDRYYNNTKDLYDILRGTYCLPQDHIYVLFADGTNPAIDRSSGVNSDMSFALASQVYTATSANLEDVLVDILTPLVDTNDHLFFWGFDHGSGAYNAPGTTGEEELVGWGSDVDDASLASWLDGVGAGYLTAAFTQCFAGGMLDNLTLSSKEHGCAATNHYEYSWGDGFAAAYNDGLLSYRNAHDVYWYAYEHDPYATDGEGPGGNVAYQVEHPWEANDHNFRIFAQAFTKFPYFEWALPLYIHGPLPEKMIGFDELLAASSVFDTEGNAIRFRIESVDNGTLLKDGKPVVPGQTTIGFGEELVWAPGAAKGQTVNAFSVRAFNGAAISDQKIPVIIQYVDPTQPDLAVDDSLLLVEDSPVQSVPVLSNDQGALPMTVVGVGAALHGTASLANGVVFYRPDAGFSGADQFTYYMMDANKQTDSAIVHIKVQPVNDPPEAYGDQFTVAPGSVQAPVDVLRNDFDEESKPLSWTPDSGPCAIHAVNLNGPPRGTITVDPNGVLLYTPQAGFVGEDEFWYQASDGVALSAPAHVVLQVVDAKTKWYQPPAPVQPGSLYYGWNEESIRNGDQIAADDWFCQGADPVTKIVWWGSFDGFDGTALDQLTLMPSFHFAIWDDVPRSETNPFSHPGSVLWQAGSRDFSSFKWEYVGRDYDPRNNTYDSAFRFEVELLSRSWFNQNPDLNSVYWLSVEAQYPVGTAPQEPFGWKTVRRDPNSSAPDAAVRMKPTTSNVGDKYESGKAIYWPKQGNAWDLAFELISEPYGLKAEQLPSAKLPGVPAYEAIVQGLLTKTTLADQWVCLGGDITDLHWWGNYQLDLRGNEVRGAGIDTFHLSIHQDLRGYPGKLMWSADVPYAAVGEMSTGTVNGEGSMIYAYDFVLPKPIAQQVEGVYWLDIRAVCSDPRDPARWRWQENQRSSEPAVFSAARQVNDGAWSYVTWTTDPVTASDMAFAITSTRLKWSQPPEPYSPPDAFNGWDERTTYWGPPIVADDWVCMTDLPVTDIQWWGSFLGWDQPTPPTLHPPLGYQLGMWTDVPAAGPNAPFSHPGTMVWRAFVTDPVTEFAGWDFDPRNPLAAPEATFKMSASLNPTEWFWQNQRQGIYWLSIAAIYPTDYNIEYPFGWKTRPRSELSSAPDAAYRMYVTTPPVIGSVAPAGMPILWPQTGNGGQAWDMAFTLRSDPTFTGEFGADNWYVRLDKSGQFVEIFDSYPPDPGHGLSLPLAALGSLAFDGLEGDDSLRISFVNGSPIPAGGIQFNGGPGGNALILFDTAAGDELMAGTGTLVHNRRMIGFNGVASPQLDSENATFVSLHALTLADGAALRSGLSGRTLRTDLLSMGTNARLDMTTGTLIVQPTSMDRDAAFEAVHGWVASARNVGSVRWMGPGIGSAAAASDPLKATGLATLLNVDDEGRRILPGLSESSIVVKHAWCGDLELDGLVSGKDYLLMDKGFLTGGVYHQFGNIDYLGGVDGDDYYEIDRAFLAQTSILSAAAVPSMVDARVFNTSTPIAESPLLADSEAQRLILHVVGQRSAASRPAVRIAQGGSGIQLRQTDRQRLWFQQEDGVLMGMVDGLF